MAKPRFSGKKIQPAWQKHARQAIPSGANILSVGRRRSDGSRMVKFTTKRGRVVRAALLEPIAHKAAKLPVSVMERIVDKLPRGAADVAVTKKGKKYRVMYTVQGKRHQVFVWERKEKEYKVYPTQKLDVTRITKAKPHVRSRTVKKVVVER
jgi:hypothetical protein